MHNTLASSHHPAAAQACRESEIPAQLSRLDALLDDLGLTTGNLCERLRPVTEQQPPTSSPAPRPALCRLHRSPNPRLDRPHPPAPLLKSSSSSSSYSIPMKSSPPITLALAAAMAGSHSFFPLSLSVVNHRPLSQSPHYNQRKARKSRRQAHAAGIRHAFRR